MSGAAGIDRLAQGSHAYGPPLSPPQDDVKLWYTPSHELRHRSKIISEGEPQLVSATNDARKFVSVINLSSTVTVYIGDSNRVNNDSGDSDAGWPLGPGNSISFDQHEYDGDLYVFVPVGAGTVEVRVMDPTAGQ